MNHSRHFLTLPGDSLVFSAFPWYPTHTVSNMSPLHRMGKAQGIGGKSTSWVTHMPRWWDGRQRLYSFLTQREWDFWLSFSRLYFWKIKLAFFPLQPWHVLQTSKVLFMNRWCSRLHNCSFKMQGKLEPPLCTNCKRVMAFDLYITALEQNGIYQKVYTI